MNILIPAAGNGSRFIQKGFLQPKPLVEVKGQPILYWSIKSLDLEGKYIFIVKKYDNDKFNQKIKEIILDIHKDSKIIYLNEATRGSAETCLVAKEMINNDHPLIVTNCDQYIKWDTQKEEFLSFLGGNID